ncbi:Hypothetical protein I596_1271 [Dokdonella koreensis DS-123]|uniref:Uncharacterized protein n=1 Tax=Dokdonella koreensis DS-123 TaxID=1300342 RepID=A0A160DTJ8_9GAMM|nr:Hypothetical protein I596_1271 [Dokdonella koreensis DS-123]
MRQRGRHCRPSAVFRPAPGGHAGGTQHGLRRWPVIGSDGPLRRYRCGRGFAAVVTRRVHPLQEPEDWT